VQLQAAAQRGSVIGVSRIERYRESILREDIVNERRRLRDDMCSER
jgi:hypothetical protein